MNQILKSRRSGTALATLIILTLLLAAQSFEAQAQTTPPVETRGWQNTGVTLNKEANTIGCFDATQPNTVIVSRGYSYYNEEAKGTFSYNYATGEVKQLSNRNLALCNEENGLLFSFTEGNNAVRIGKNPADELALPFRPSAIAADGTLQLYGLKNGRLYYSADGGRTNEERGQQFNGKVESVSAAAQDARIVYVTVKGADIPEEKFYEFVPYYYSVYASSDAGRTWEKRYENRTSRDKYFQSVQMLPGRATPVDWLLLAVQSGGSPSSSRTTYHLSTDGGRTFREIGYRGRDYAFLFYRTNEALIRLRTGSGGYGYVPQNEQYQISRDGGISWTNLSLPFGVQFGVNLFQATNTPNNLFTLEGPNLWHSTDGGVNWQNIATLDRTNNYSYFVNPNAPTTLLTVKDKQIYRLDWPNADKTLTAPVQPNKAPGGNYYTETGHNLSPLFRAYWEAKGGLAQFGFPRTEAIREYNPTDGKIYTVQYFERNRFEYHPENAGTQYEILLGLLGNQLTEARRTKGETPFNRVAAPPPTIPNVLYFPETGHTLAHTFKDYWEAKGGLALYGFPTSEEFDEVNPDDGKTYTVQYFERNRFEYHPENKGTRYEVLLGLLGNTLLKQKGWLS